MSRLDRLNYLQILFNERFLIEFDQENKLCPKDYIIGNRYIPCIIRKYHSFTAIYIIILISIFPLILLPFLLKSIVAFLSSNRHPIDCSCLMLPLSIALPRVSKNAQKLIHNEKWLITPFSRNDSIPKEKRITVFELLSFNEVIEAYIDAVRVFYYIPYRFGLKYGLVATHAFYWFMYKSSLRKVPLDVELFFANHKDMYSPLLDKLPHKNKTLIQHGTEIIMRNPNKLGNYYIREVSGFGCWAQNMPFKYKTIGRVFCFTEKEREALKMSILNCSPLFMISGYSLKEFNENLNGEKAVLIVGYYSLYSKIEEKVVSLFQNTGIKIYLKNHPVFPSNVYKSLENKYDFILLNGPIFPRVDVVFSYDSTLALEYEALGAKIVFYDLMDDLSLKKCVSEEIERINIVNLTK